MKKYKKSSAFTLAEVLITLAIIGVVASLTISTVVINHQKKETVTRLKKAYSALAQTTNKAIYEYGAIKSWDFDRGISLVSSTSSTSDDDDMKGRKAANTKHIVEKYIIPYLNVMKNCGLRTDGDCAFEYANLNNRSNHKPINDWGCKEPWYRVVLADGTAIFFYAAHDEFTHTEDAYGNKLDPAVTVERIYVAVMIDVNGIRKPNVFGRDIFLYVYWLSNDHGFLGFQDYGDQFIPNAGGKQHDRSHYFKHACSKGKSGQGCAALIMKDGWQIKSDYPW